MAGIDTEMQVGKIEDVADVLTSVVAGETPFQAMARKGKDLNQEVFSAQMYLRPMRGYDGILDGTDVATFDGVVRESATGVCQEFRQPWLVTQRAEVNRIHGLGGAGEKAFQQAECLAILKESMEAAFLGTMEQQRQDKGTGKVFRTRGAIKWLSTAAQAVDPVPANFRPDASSVLDGTSIAAVTETAVQGVLGAMWNRTRGGKKVLHGFVGQKLKDQFDSFGALADAGAAFATFPVRTFNNDSSDKLVIRVVDRLEFTLGTVWLHPSPHIYRSMVDGTVDANYSSRSGVFCKMDTWELRYQQRPQMSEMENKGGGPRGYANVMVGLFTSNPLENTYITAAS